MQIAILDYFHIIYFILTNILQYGILLAQFYNEKKKKIGEKNVRLEKNIRPAQGHTVRNGRASYQTYIC